MIEVATKIKSIEDKYVQNCIYNINYKAINLYSIYLFIIMDKILINKSNTNNKND